MNTFKEYLDVAEGIGRRGFLKGLAGFAAGAAVPTPVVKMLSTPAGVASLTIPAALALLKGVEDHLAQWDAEDDDDLFDAQEDMADDLGFYGDDDEDMTGTDQMFDLLDLYRTNPELAAAQLIKHLQSQALDPKDIEKSFVSRADNPDWRYLNKMQAAEKEPESSTPGASTVDIARLAGLAKGTSGSTDQAPAPTVKDMGTVGKNTPALPAPTKPEVDLTPGLKSKEKVPARRKDDDTMSEKLGDNRPSLGTKRDQGKSVRKWREQHGLTESTELTGILKNAGLKG